MYRKRKKKRRKTNMHIIIDLSKIRYADIYMMIEEKNGKITKIIPKGEKIELFLQFPRKHAKEFTKMLSDSVEILEIKENLS